MAYLETITKEHILTDPPPEHPSAKQRFNKDMSVISRKEVLATDGVYGIRLFRLIGIFLSNEDLYMQYMLHNTYCNRMHMT